MVKRWSEWNTPRQDEAQTEYVQALAAYLNDHHINGPGYETEASYEAKKALGAMGATGELGLGGFAGEYAEAAIDYQSGSTYGEFDKLSLVEKGKRLARGLAHKP
jgi:hypothetical protein